MARWQPPIPSGALWSREVIESNAGALLAYCYDAVLTDGTFTIQLADTSGEMGVEYRTVKRWWAALRAGPFFASVKDRGRLGFVVRMADDWLDWRILKARQAEQPQGTKNAPETEGTQTAPGDAQDHFKSFSRPDEGPSMSLDTSAYKVLIASGEQEHAAPSPQAAPSAPVEGKLKGPAAPTVIRTALYDACQIAPTARREIKLNANQKAKNLWKAGVKAGKSDAEIAEAITYVGSWCRKHAWQCKDGSAPTPSIIGDYWRQAIDARPKPAAYQNGVNGHAEPFDYGALEAEAAERAKQAAARREAVAAKIAATTQAARKAGAR